MTSTSPQLSRTVGSRKGADRAGQRVTSMRGEKRKDALIGLAFVAPLVAGVIGLAIVPFGFAIWYGFHDWRPLSGSFDWIGLDNYSRLISDPAVWGALGTTFTFAGLLLVINITLALLLANLLNIQFRFRGVFRTIYFLPMVVSSVAWVLMWQYLVASNGGINGFLAMVGIEGPNWLRDPNTALITIVVIQVIKGLGMNMILFLAALQNVPGELYEAAKVDGADATRMFFRITLPLITPTLMMVIIITFLGALDVFVPIQVLTEGGPGDSTTVISYLLYRTAFSEQQFGYASVIGVLLFVVMLAVTSIQWWARKKWVHDEV